MFYVVLHKLTPDTLLRKNIDATKENTKQINTFYVAYIETH